MASLLVVTVLLGGSVTYIGLSAVAPATVHRVSCGPSASAVCGRGSSLHDLGLAIPFRYAQAGSVVPAAVLVPTGATASQFAVDFGDGSIVTGPGPIAAHAYRNAGSYLVSARALIGASWHDSYRHLERIAVGASLTAYLAASVPIASGTIVSNGTAVPAQPPTAVLLPGENLTLLGRYLSLPTDPSYSSHAPVLVGPSGLPSLSSVSTNTSAQSTFRFPSSGVFQVTLVGASGGAAVVYSNFTWTVFVAPPGVHAGLALSAESSSPHPGALAVYELWPGGTYSIDPAINYDVIGEETLDNVDETLVEYNGSQDGPTSASFIPVLASCVPGSRACITPFGSTLVRGDNFTFVIDGAARFYDPATGDHWGVYPTDVLFSLARAMAYSDLPCSNCNPGWIVGQALMPSGGTAWDGGIHAPLNNTPTNIYRHVILNGSDCPPVALTDPRYHGCVTLWADGGGHAWPYFLQLLADPQGSAIIPCGWYSAPAQAAGIPYWTYGNISGSGDHPCQPPGVAYGSATPPSRGWDSWEVAGANVPGWGNVVFSNVGSGPYYISDYRPGTGYTMRANPAYAAPAGCYGPGCYPPPGAFARSVSVTYETSPTPGEEAFDAGVADFARIPPTDASFFLALAALGKVGGINYPTLTLGFYPFNLGFDPVGAAALSPNPVTVPSDFLSHLAVRQFLARAYPYDTIQATVNVRDGIVYEFKQGGAIPQFMGDFYPRNVSWPDSDPCVSATNLSCPTFWWSEGRALGSPYYDAELSACTSSAPCEFPVAVPSGFPDVEVSASLWAASVSALSGGALKIDPITMATYQDLLNLGDFHNPLPLYGAGWAPDYPDPTDYVVGMYAIDFANAFAAVVARPAFNAPACHPGTDFRWWAGQGASLSIPDDCQGAAYAALTGLLGLAGADPDLSQRTLYYNWMEQIANDLTLYLHAFQFDWQETFGPWIDATSINTNPMTGGGAQQYWFDIQGAGVV